MKTKIFQKFPSNLSVTLLLLIFSVGIFVVLKNITPTFAQEVSPSPSVEVSPSPSVTVEPSPTSPSDAELVAVVVENTDEDSVGSLDLNPVEATSAQLVTDKADYAPTDTVVISGTGLSANTTYIIIVSSQDPPAITHTESVTTDENGNFVYAYQLDGISRSLYTVEIKDASGNVAATTTFTDPPPPSGPAGTDFAQCANENPTLGDCDWIGSILQNSNSKYFEGMTVPQRLLFRDTQIADGTHHITFTYQYTKAGIHAYDFLTTVNPTTTPDTVQGNTPPETLNPCADLGGADTTACNSLDPGVNSPTAQITVPSDPFKSKDSNDGDALVGTGSTQATKETNYETANPGGRKITVYAPNTSAFSGASITLTHSPATADSDTGDTDVSVDITFTSTGCSTGSGCNYLLYFGGHLAVTGSDNTSDSNWGPGLGSSQISGGPYHIKSVKFDGSGGSLDNQIKGADILVPQEGNIIVDKVTDPSGDPQSFTFNPTWESSFGLTDVAAPHDSGPLVAGAYSVSETVPSGWDLTNTNCVSSIGDTETAGSLELDPLETITCTFTNTKRGHVIIVKDVIGNPDPTDFTFNNNFGNGNPATFMLDEDTNVTLPSSQNFEVLPGTFSVSEDPVANWQSPESTSCTDGSPVNAIVVAAGEIVTCTFVNEELVKIILIKNTIGGDGDFDFDGTGDGLPTDIDLTTTGGTATQTFSNLDQDNEYSIAENVPAGWDLTSATCDKGETVNDIDIEPGETVTCTFTNTKLTVTVATVIHKNGDESTNYDLNAISNGGNLLLGSSVHDKATVAANIGTPGGTLTYKFFSTSDCTEDSIDETVAVGNESSSHGPLGAGDYSFLAHYNGDGNYPEADSSCERLHVDKADTTTKTEVHNTSHEDITNTAVALGSIVHDSATVGTQVDSLVIGGTVTYNFFHTNDCTDKFSTETVAVGTESSTAGPLGAGAYSYQATYNGDDNYNGSTGDCEPFKVNQATPTVTTEVHNSTEGVITTETLDTKVHDKATVEGIGVAGLEPSGDVDFTFFNNGSCSLTGTAAGTVGLDGNDPGVAHPSDEQTLPGAGNYSFKAHYLGDDNYDSADSDCEPFTYTTLTINKLANGVGTFDYNVAGPTNATPSLTTTNGTTGSVTIPILSGSYTVGEDDPTPFIFVSLSCAGANPSSPADRTSPSFNAPAGQDTACNFENTKQNATRTQGFWATHTAFSNDTWTDDVPGSEKNVNNWGAGACTTDKFIDSDAITVDNELMGGFWANVANKSPNGKRTDIDKARMALLQQLLAALLNRYGLGTSDGGLIASAEAAYCGTSINAIRTATGNLGTFNQSGDTIPLGFSVPNATPKDSKSQADIPFWNTTTF